MSLETLGSGGPIILVLAVLSLLSLALIVVKIHQLWPVRSGSALRARAFEQWKSGDTHGARQTVEGGKSPADRVTAYAMKALAAGFKGPALEAELTRRGNEEVAEMGSLIRLLELIAMVSPLLGLLGTVLGMIQSFQQLEMAEGAANEIEVDILTGDDYCRTQGVERIDFLKIDAEGMEMDVLDGAADLIARDKPLIWIEVLRPNMMAFVQGWCRKANYRVVDSTAYLNTVDYFAMPRS